MAGALQIAGTAGRGSSAGSRSAVGVADGLRRSIAGIVGVDDARRVVLTSGATQSLNMAIQGVVLASRGRAGHPPRIVTTMIEHNAVLRPLLALKRRGEAAIERVRVGPDTRVSARAVIAAAQGRGDRRPAELVVMCAASNVTGVVQPVGEVGEALRGTATLLLVDASQTAGVGAVPLVCDLMAFSGHKRFGGPAGVGALVIGAGAHPIEIDPSGLDAATGVRIEPTLVGGSGHNSREGEMPGTLPERFEAGTSNAPGFAGWLAAIEHGRLVPERERRRAYELAEGLRAELGRLGGGVRVLGGGGDGACEPIVAFTVEGYSPEEVAAVLDSEFGIVVRAGLHCAPGAHEAMGTLAGGGAVRASMGMGTTPDDVERLVWALGRMVGG